MPDQKTQADGLDDSLLPSDPEQRQIVATITRELPHVQRAQVAQAAAIADRHAADAALLAAVIDIIKPALPGICSKVVMAFSPAFGHKWLPERALCLSQDAEDVGPVATSKGFSGRDVFLTEASTLLVLVYGVDPEVCRLDPTRPIAPHDAWTSIPSTWALDAFFAHFDYKVETFLLRIATALDRDHRGRSTSAERNAARARKVRAVLALLEGGS